jgi:hypothetical protein
LGLRALERWPWKPHFLRQAVPLQQLLLLLLDCSRQCSELLLQIARQMGVAHFLGCLQFRVQSQGELELLPVLLLEELELLLRRLRF